MQAAEGECAKSRDSTEGAWRSSRILGARLKTQAGTQRSFYTDMHFCNVPLHSVQELIFELKSNFVKLKENTFLVYYCIYIFTVNL